MGYRNGEWPWKFYWEQVAEVRKLLVRFVEELGSIDVEKYLRICEQLGQEPDPEKMPLDASVFPEEIQVAFFMYNLVSERWEGMSGTYMGKNWVECQHLFDVYEIDNPREILFFMQMYDGIIITRRAEDATRKRKAEEQKRQQASGKTYTHNVRG